MIAMSEGWMPAVVRDVMCVRMRAASEGLEWEDRVRREDLDLDVGFSLLLLLLLLLVLVSEEESELVSGKSPPWVS